MNKKYENQYSHENGLHNNKDVLIKADSNLREGNESFPKKGFESDASSLDSRMYDQPATAEMTNEEIISESLAEMNVQDDNEPSQPVKYRGRSKMDDEIDIREAEVQSIDYIDYEDKERG